MAAGEIVLRLHLNQAAGRALEFELQAFAVIELRRRGGSRHHDLDAAVVELIDEHDEAARRVLIRRRELRYVGDEQGAVEPRELDVVVLTARALAQLAAVEPGDVRADGAGVERPSLDLQRDIAHDLAARERGEALLELAQGFGCARIEIRRRPLELAQPVVDTGVELEDIDVCLDQLDGGHEALALQSLLVQIAGRGIRGGYAYDAAAEQALQEPGENHCVANVGDEELIEAENARTLCDVRGREIQRIGASFDERQLGVDSPHEAIEVLALAGHRSERGVEGVHQQRLAAADAAPQIQTPRRRALGALRKPGDARAQP